MGEHKGTDNTNIRHLRAVAKIMNSDTIKRLLELRVQGYTLVDAAAECGVKTSTASRWIRTYLANNPIAAAEEFRLQELEKYELVERQLLTKTRKRYVKVANGGLVMVPVEDANGNPIMQQDPNSGKMVPVLVALEDDGPQNDAISLLVKLWQRKSMLMGLDMPVKVKITDTPPTNPIAGLTPEQVEFAMKKWINKMNGRNAEVIDAVPLAADPIAREV